MAERSLQHREPDTKDDETLRREARVHLASEPALQLVAELIARLRELDVPWWTPVKLRERWGAVERMSWFRERSDVRQQITTSLTGLSPRAARRKTPDFQGSLVDSVIDEGDITPRAFEAAFDPRDLAVYGPAGAYWHFFRESMPWDQDTTAHQEIVAWLLRSLLADRSPFEGIGRTPILTPWDVRTAIDGRLWQTRIPLEIRVAIDNARLQQERERPGVPFHADGELAIAGPEIIAANIPPREILPLVLQAQKAMRFDVPRSPSRGDAARAGSSDATARPRDSVPPMITTAAAPPGSSPTAASPAAEAALSGKPGAGGAAPAASAAASPAAPAAASPAAPAAASPAAPAAASPAAPPAASQGVSSAASLHGAPPAASVSVGAAPAAGLRMSKSVPPPSAAHGASASKSPADRSAAPSAAEASRSTPASDVGAASRLPASDEAATSRPPPSDATATARPPAPDATAMARPAAPPAQRASSHAAASNEAILAALGSLDVEEDGERTGPWAVPTSDEIAAGMASPDGKRLRDKS